MCIIILLLLRSPVFCHSIFTPVGLGVGLVVGLVVGLGVGLGVGLRFDWGLG